MQTERWEKVRSLYNSAQQRPPHEREAFLDGACSGDPLLRQDVEIYINSQDRTVPLGLHSEIDVFAETLRDDPHIGKTFHKYSVRKKLGAGGMAVVYLATDTNLGRDVALKILPAVFSMDQERLLRFQREAKATSVLNHPNIVTVHEIGQVNSCEFIVTEFVDGETLRARLLRGKVEMLESLKIISQIAEALAAAHRAGVVHRDIKPENVMLRPDGYVKVLDFGLAKLTNRFGGSVTGDVDIPDSKFNFTTPGTLLGTVAYMSPEQAEGISIDNRTDIWGLGVILYEMTTGNVPFDGPTPSHTLVAILEQEPEPFECESAELKRIILKALEKDRANRYQTADEFLADIDPLKRKLGYVSDENIAAAVTVPSVPAAAFTVPSIPAAALKPAPLRNAKRLWLVPAFVAFLLIMGVGIFGVVRFAFSESAGTDSNRAEATPSPVVSPTESESGVFISPTPFVTYVEPTPIPTATVSETSASPDETVDAAKREERTRPQPTHARMPEPVAQKPKPKPKPKPRPTQDPNCVFTNSCN